MDGEAQPKNVLEAKLAVMREIGYVQKTGKLKMRGEVKYTFASEVDLIRALRERMIHYGLVLTREKITDFREGKYRTSTGESQLARVVQRFCFTHVPSDTKDWIEVVGEGGDVGDKASPKALTIGKKYALREWFMLETGDDPDAARPGETFAAALAALGRAPSVRALAEVMVAADAGDYTREERDELRAAWAQRYARLCKEGLLQVKSLEELKRYRDNFERKRERGLLPRPIYEELVAVEEERYNSLGGRSRQER